MSTNRRGVTPPNIRETEKRPSVARPLKNFRKNKKPRARAKGQKNHCRLKPRRTNGLRESGNGSNGFFLTFFSDSSQ